MSKVIKFKQKRVRMMPGDWKVTGSPTPHELRNTLETIEESYAEYCKALDSCSLSNELAIREKIRLLELTYTILTDSLLTGESND
jgi:hypothetical protein